MAVLVHCCSHVLNLAITNSCALPLVRNMINSVTEVFKFFQHGKREDKLEVIVASFQDSKRKRVKPLCMTRWVERHDALEVFLELYPAIVQSLSDTAYKEDSVECNNDSIKDANGLLAAVEKFSLLLTCVVVQNIMSYINGIKSFFRSRHWTLLWVLS